MENKMALLIKANLEIDSEIVSLPPNVSLMRFSDHHSLRAILQNLKKSGFERALIGGGDGTLHCAVEETMKLKHQDRIPLGVVPLGTANDFAKTVADCQQGVSELLIQAGAADVEKIDIGWVNEKPFLNVVTGGDLTKATTEASSETKTKFGKWAYYAKALAQWPNLKSYKMIFKDEFGSFSTRCMGFAVANACQVGGGLKVAPAAKIDDGYLDLLVVPEQSTLELTRVASELLKEDPNFKSLNIIQKRIRDLTIEVEEKIQINADGEPLEGSYFKFKLSPRILEMVVMKTDALLN